MTSLSYRNYEWSRRHSFPNRNEWKEWARANRAFERTLNRLWHGQILLEGCYLILPGDICPKD